MDDYWRAVPGYPNYQVSQRGEVHSLVRKKILAQVEGERGYMLVNLHRHGRPRNFLVHRLVAMAFLGAIPRGPRINHKDGDKRNNCLDNLEICTPEQNRAHAARTGLLLRGEANPSSRLTDAKVRAMRQMRAEGAGSGTSLTCSTYPRRPCTWSATERPGGTSSERRPEIQPVALALPQLKSQTARVHLLA